MRNITVTVSDEAYRQARVWAAHHDTSVSAVVQHLLTTLPGIARAANAFPPRGERPAAAPAAIRASHPTPHPPGN
jgi:hypothetical protein